MNNIFFDFDGTIVNSQERLYNLFCKLCPENKYSYEEYWDIKRNHITQKDFLMDYCNFTEDQALSFKKQWFAMIEDEVRMREDFLVDGVFDLIKKLSKKYNLYLVTHRQNKEFVKKQIDDFGLTDCFRDLLVTEQKITKTEFIKQKVKIEKGNFVIGDTGEDIKTAQDLGIKSIAVSWGVLNRQVLEKYKPDFLIDSVSEIYNIEELF